MTRTRRDTVAMLAAGLGGALVLPRLAAAQAAGDQVAGSQVAGSQAGRSLHLVLQGFSLGIHIPQVLAVRELMQAAGYAAPQLDRIESMQVIAQTIVSNSAAAGDSDVPSALRAIEAGAPVTLIGLVYNSTSQVLLANTDRIRSFADFRNPENAIAMNSRGDFIYVMLAGALDRNGVDIDDVTVVEMGGSGSRLKALLSGRVAAVPVHFDQADEVLKQGPYKVLVEPWKVYERFLAEAWLVNTAWLAEADNQKAAVALNKAMVSAFRRANTDYDWFAAGYRKYATVPDAAKAPDAVLKPVWQKLSTEIRAWPDDGGFKRAYLEQLLPVYRKAHVIRRTPDLARVMEPRFLDQALRELG